jgi:hypothetical protein
MKPIPRRPPEHSPDDSAEVAGLPEKIAQPHGGALFNGGKRGNRGGRPPSEIRKAALRSLDKRIPVLDRIADNPKARDADRINAVKTLASIGFGASMAMSEVRQKLEATVAMIQASLPEPQALPIILDLRRIWLGR